MSQGERIVQYCLGHVTTGISPMEAFGKLKITKLSTRIGELERVGYKFKREWRKSEDGRYLRYWLEEIPCQK